MNRRDLPNVQCASIGFIRLTQSGELQAQTRKKGSHKYIKITHSSVLKWASDYLQFDLMCGSVLNIAPHFIAVSQNIAVGFLQVEAPQKCTQQTVAAGAVELPDAVRQHNVLVFIDLHSASIASADEHVCVWISPPGVLNATDRVLMPSKSTMIVLVACCAVWCLHVVCLFVFHFILVVVNVFVSTFVELELKLWFAFTMKHTQIRQNVVFFFAQICDRFRSVAATSELYYIYI